MPTLIRYLVARRFLTRYLGKRAVRFLPGGWVVFLAYPLARWAWRRRLKRVRALTPRTS
jgi:hypothetical protein